MKNKLALLILALLAFSCVNQKLTAGNGESISGKSIEVANNDYDMPPIIDRRGLVTTTSETAKPAAASNPSLYIKDQMVKTMKQKYNISKVISGKNLANPLENADEILQEYSKGDFVLIFNNYSTQDESAVNGEHDITYKVNAILARRADKSIIAEGSCKYHNKSTKNLNEVYDEAKSYCFKQLIDQML